MYLRSEGRHEDMNGALRRMEVCGSWGEAVERGDKAKAIMGLRKRGLRGDAEVEALVKQAM